MTSIELYYRFKPFIPPGIRVALRQWVMARRRKRCQEIWPVLPGSERPPSGWGGWPDGKKFAFVLTHDVETEKGLHQIRQLAELEIGLGFRSSFNLIPEGAYRAPASLRAWLQEQGFEVGVHDLNHDGKLYSSREDFHEKARKIRSYLAEWEAVGFRSGFMLRNLDWLHDLGVEYDSSTFDTDPFEPQPDGAGTIFPFWVPAPNSATRDPHSAFRIPHSAFNGGYVELPYTLPQDSTLFLYGRESGPDIWLQKLDWVAQHGGLAMVIVHPDYICFQDDTNVPHTFPIRFYQTLLEHVRDVHGDACWHALPREVARHVRPWLSPDETHRPVSVPAQDLDRSR